MMICDELLKAFSEPNDLLTPEDNDYDLGEVLEFMHGKEKGMVVKGKEIKEVTVEVDKMELFRGLAEHLGLEMSVFEYQTDRRWVEAYDEPNTTQVMRLEEEVDDSYHGTPQWRRTGRTIMRPAAVQAYRPLKEIFRIIGGM